MAVQPFIVIPAEAGIQTLFTSSRVRAGWAPAFAGVTVGA